MRNMPSNVGGAGGRKLWRGRSNMKRKFKKGGCVAAAHSIIYNGAFKRMGKPDDAFSGCQTYFRRGAGRSLNLQACALQE